MFPHTPYPLMADSWEQEQEFQVLVKRGVGNVRQAREQLDRPLFSAHYRWILVGGQLNDLKQFVRNVRGPAEVFALTTWDAQTWLMRHRLAVADGTAYHWLTEFVREASDFELSIGGVNPGLVFSLGCDEQLLYAGDMTELTAWPDYGGATSVRAIYTPGPSWETTWRIQTSGGSDALKLDQGGGSGVVTPSAGLRTATHVAVRNIKSLSDPDYGSLWVRTINGDLEVPNDGDWHTVSTEWDANGVDTPYLAFESEGAAYDLDFLVTRPSITFHREHGIHWLPTRDAPVDADPYGRFYLMLLPAAGTPTAGQEVWIEQSRGRRLRFVALDSDPKPERKLSDNIYSYEIDVVEAEEPAP